MLFRSCSVLTAVGGGVLRDIMAAKIPGIFRKHIYCVVAMLGAILFYLLFINTPEVVHNFVIIGATSTLEAGVTNHLLIIFCSVLTAVGGGVLRDIMAAKIPGIFRKHIYCVVAIFGAVFFYSLLLNTPESMHNFITIATILLVVVFRYLAFHFELNLPKVKIEE